MQLCVVDVGEAQDKKSHLVVLSTENKWHRTYSTIKISGGEISALKLPFGRWHHYKPE